MNLLLDRSVLPVGTHLLLPMVPEVIQRVEFRTADRQPHQPDSQDVRLASRILGRMTTVPVQQERHLPSSIPLMDQPEELLEVFLRCFFRSKNNRVPLWVLKCPLKITRFALALHKGTSASSPRRAQQARNGGNSRRSVSSSNDRPSRLFSAQQEALQRSSGWDWPFRLTVSEFRHRDAGRST